MCTMGRLNLLLIIFANYALPIFTSVQNPAVIIIGAGPSGIAAATRLLENGIKDFLILEAEPRIGGRIHSVKFGDAYMDLGGEWCHGEKNNIVYNTVKDLNILKHTTFSTKLYHSSRKTIDDDFAMDLFEIIDSIYSADGNRDETEQTTVGDFCIKKYNNTVYEKYQDDREKLGLALSLLDYFELSVLSSEGSFSWFDPVAKNDYRNCEGDLNLNWNGLGYKTILDVLMRKFPDPRQQLPIDDKILLNKEVIKIRWNEFFSDKRVTVVTSDQSKYACDHIIFTPSIGVLKERANYMFSPQLPRYKQQVIKMIGFGSVMKVILHFPNKWWGNSTGFNFLWSAKDKRSSLIEFPEGPSWNGRSWITYLFCVYANMEYNPNVLVGWFTGNLVPAIELLDENTLMRGVEYAFKKFLGHMYNISQPNSIIYSKWYSNPHFRGTYSFQTISSGSNGGSMSAEEYLSLPIKHYKDNTPVIPFAGEATHPHYYSTVHGAVESGYREADRLTDVIYKKKFLNS